MPKQSLVDVVSETSECPLTLTPARAFRLSFACDAHLAFPPVHPSLLPSREKQLDTALRTSEELSQVGKNQVRCACLCGSEERLDEGW